MHDAIELEQHGVPAVCLITDPFRASAAGIAKARGHKGLRCAVVEHPLGYLNSDELRERAEHAASQAAAIALGQPA